MSLMQEFNLNSDSSKLNMLNGKSKTASETSDEKSSKAQSFQDIFKSIALNYRPKNKDHDYEAKYIVRTESMYYDNF